MKTHTIKTPTAELLIVELPEAGRIEKDDWYIDDASNVRQSVIEYNEDYWSRRPDCIKIHEELFPLFTEHTLLGKPSEIKEEDASELVESWESIAKDGTRVYDNYHRKLPMKRTATESLLSALESEIFWDVNPFTYEKTESEIMADKLMHCRFITKEEAKFWEAELRTFDRNRSIIFVKN